MRHDPEEMQPWREKLAGYWDRAGHGPMRETIVQALDCFEREGRVPPLRVVDLGCGVGRDTLKLLALGHHVQAIDREAVAVERLVAACPAEARPRLVPIVGRFEEAGWAPVDLTVSSFALPFCPPDRFPALWTTIGQRLLPGGRLACQLLGPNDGFAGQPGITLHGRPEVEALLAAYRIERLEEEETDSVTPRGRAKHWHLYHLVARKR
ncbi:class I SAM-dependent methyltransferase [Geminicoccus roseus]|uniref:class I SAM-dependent methyltransferase n=1 Tax=Geminicoccus roseus TaxID=404900 RepID=UPI000413BD20|nr:class I SAM-dependent methyltransferase [Geminicoccus roseus]